MSWAQSAATLQPHAPFTHAVLLERDEHETQVPPLVPQVAAASPEVHVPFEQHPPLQAWLTLQEVVHVDPLQA